MMIVPLLVIPIAAMFWKEPFFSWLVRRHRSAQLSTTSPLVKEQSGKWMLGIIVGVVTLVLAILLHYSKSPAVFALLGILPGVASLGVAIYHAPSGDGRNWLMGFSVAVLISGPVLMIYFREFILELDPDPRSAVLLLVPAIFVAIISERLKAKDRIKEHERAVAESQKKLTSK